MKKMNNKGFSLVELIIVIAIMAILIAVLAPQYLRYVEKSRLQADNSTLGEVANAIKVAASNDTINTEIATAGTVTVGIPTGTAGAATGLTAGSELEKEINRVCGTTLILKSNSYTKATTAPSISATIDSQQVCIVTGSNYISEVGATGTTITF
jgi:type IV pilus assembly protein PilA